MREGVKNIHLHFTIFKETISPIVSDTLQAGGQVEAPPAEPKIGDMMPDKTIYAGISPETNQAMYTTPRDAPLTMTFNKAKKYAAKLDAHGHQDWRVPTKNELRVLYNSRAAIGGFEVSGSDPAGWYWSAPPAEKWGAWCQRFSDGRQDYNGSKASHSSVRCVR
jgi:hypothetical protein